MRFGMRVGHQLQRFWWEEQKGSESSVCQLDFSDNWSDQDWILSSGSMCFIFLGAVRNHLKPSFQVAGLQSLSHALWPGLEPSTPELAPHTSHVISHHLTRRQWPQQNCQREHNDLTINGFMTLVDLDSHWCAHAYFYIHIDICIYIYEYWHPISTYTHRCVRVFAHVSYMCII